MITWLGMLIDLAFDPSWDLAKRRKLVAAAMELYAKRGTPEGLIKYVEIYTGVRPVLIEAFLQRPHQPALLGIKGTVLGCTTALARTAKVATPDELLLARFAHRFEVLVFVEDECDEAVLLAVVDRIVELNKPAHTVHALRPIRPGAEVGFARIGLDLMLGARRAPKAELGGCPLPGAPVRPTALLGVDSILGQKRPQYARPLMPEL